MRGVPLRAGSGVAPCGVGGAVVVVDRGIGLAHEGFPCAVQALRLDEGADCGFSGIRDVGLEPNRGQAGGDGEAECVLALRGTLSW